MLVAIAMNIIYWCHDGCDKSITKGGQRQCSHGCAMKFFHREKPGKGD